MRKHTGRAMSWERVGDALEVSLHREPCNEIGTTALADLELLAQVVRDGALGARALILHSTVPAGFCAGADLRELQDGLQKRGERLSGGLERLNGWLGPRRKRLLRRGAQWLVVREIRAFLDRIHRVFDTIDTAPITTIAAVHGVVFGGGFELALTCDLIIADRSARFCFPELRLGLVPGFGGIPRLRRDVGNAVVRDVLLTGRSINAKRAHGVGLVSQVVGRGQALEVSRAVADQAARFGVHTTAAAKAFAKRLPTEELEREKRTFCRLVTQPEVRAALDDFATSDELRPYLP